MFGHKAKPRTENHFEGNFNFSFLVPGCGCAQAKQKSLLRLLIVGLMGQSWNVFV